MKAIGGRREIGLGDVDENRRRVATGAVGRRGARCLRDERGARGDSCAGARAAGIGPADRVRHGAETGSQGKGVESAAAGCGDVVGAGGGPHAQAVIAAQGANAGPTAESDVVKVRDPRQLRDRHADIHGPGRCAANRALRGGGGRAAIVAVSAKTVAAVVINPRVIFIVFLQNARYLRAARWVVSA